MVAFAATGSAVTADLQSAGNRSLKDAMERLGVAASTEQAVRPDQSWAATRLALVTASDIVGNLARLQNRDKQLLLLTSRSSVHGPFTAGFARDGEAAPPDLSDDVAAVVAVAKAGNVALPRREHRGSSKRRTTSSLALRPLADPLVGWEGPTQPLPTARSSPADVALFSSNNWSEELPAGQTLFSNRSSCPFLDKLSKGRTVRTSEHRL